MAIIDDAVATYRETHTIKGAALPLAWIEKRGSRAKTGNQRYHTVYLFTVYEADIQSADTLQERREAFSLEKKAPLI